MKVNVAGAGAGKTSLMAELITGCEIPEGRFVFCIAFTNAATENIVEKVKKKLGVVPENIKISTIHSFLYQELIKPYYYIMFGKHFERLSVIDLPDNERFRRSKLAELETDNTLHITNIPEKAKWIVYKKSGDRKEQKDLRQKILERFSSCCEAIYVDEAQDISEDVRFILESLDKAGITITLYGDPKQDIKGAGNFRAIIDSAVDVNYISICHRCPQMHLDISNTLAVESEQQIADIENSEGSINVVFESDIEDINDFFESGDFGLKYISMKRERFDTHENSGKKKRFETLYYEVHRAMDEKWIGIIPDIEIHRLSFCVVEQMIEDFVSGMDPSAIIKLRVKCNVFDVLTSRRYAQMVSAFSKDDISVVNTHVVSSIEVVKGCEAKRCLFILSPDLAPYLFREKIEDNKTKHLLYVALTRSLDNLTILIMKEVEEKYTRERIQYYLST